MKGFSDILPPDFHSQLTPLNIPSQNLQIFVLGLAEQLAMKIVALREQDLEDIEILLPQLTDFHAMRLWKNVQRIATFRPDWAQKIEYFLEEQRWKKS